MVCPLMTQQRHWLCTAAMVLMPISAPIKVLVQADTILSPELGSGYAATRVHHATRRRGGGVAGRGACATGGGRSSHCRINGRCRDGFLTKLDCCPLASTRRTRVAGGSQPSHAGAMVE